MEIIVTGNSQIATLFQVHYEDPTYLISIIILWGVLQHNSHDTFEKSRGGGVEKRWSNLVKLALRKYQSQQNPTLGPVLLKTSFYVFYAPVGGCSLPYFNISYSI